MVKKHGRKFIYTCGTAIRDIKRSICLFRGINLTCKSAKENEYKERILVE